MFKTHGISSQVSRIWGIFHLAFLEDATTRLTPESATRRIASKEPTASTGETASALRGTLMYRSYTILTYQSPTVVAPPRPQQSTHQPALCRIRPDAAHRRQYR
ncbi:unnamed protein product [Ectocarpus sp. 6 AP-2014]